MSKPKQPQKTRASKSNSLTSKPASKANAPEQVASVQIKRAGQPRIFETSQRFRDCWQKFFDYCDKNPWIKKDFVKSGESAGMMVDLPTQRPYTLQGFHAYYDLSGDYCDQLLRSLKESAASDYQQYLSVYQWAKNKCTSQKLEGALVGAFNANLVARIEGIKEQTDVTTGGDKLPAAAPVQINPEELSEALKKLKEDF